MTTWIITLDDRGDVRGRAKPRWQGAQKRAEIEQITAAHSRPCVGDVHLPQTAKIGIPLKIDKIANEPSCYPQRCFMSL